MKWGVKGAVEKFRGPQGPGSKDSEVSTTIKQKAKKEKVRSLSNAELQAAINRMQLEQNFKRLAVNDKPAVTRFISSTLLEVGKREVQTAVGKKLAGSLVKKVATGGVA
jgi:hypothetical protein